MIYHYSNNRFSNLDDAGLCKCLEVINKMSISDITVENPFSEIFAKYWREESNSAFYRVRDHILQEIAVRWSEDHKDKTE